MDVPEASPLGEPAEAYARVVERAHHGLGLRIASVPDHVERETRVALPEDGTDGEADGVGATVGGTVAVAVGAPFTVSTPFGVSQAVPQP